MKALIPALLTLALAACALPQQGRRNVDTPQNQAAAARAAAATLCGASGVRQAPGTDGTNRSDYTCERR